MTNNAKRVPNTVLFGVSDLILRRAVFVASLKSAGSGYLTVASVAIMFFGIFLVLFIISFLIDLVIEQYRYKKRY